MRNNQMIKLTSIIAMAFSMSTFAETQLPEGWATHSAGLMVLQKGKTEEIYIVKTREELVKALSSKNAKTIYVDGMIDGTENKEGKVKTPAEYLLAAGFKPKNQNSKDIYWEEFWGLNKDGSFTKDGYLGTYSPENYGKKALEGELETIRKNASKLQSADITIKVNSNTKILGLGKNSGFKNIQLQVSKAENVVIRNLEFIAVTDYFPGWDPEDGAKGNWNSEYDTLTIIESKGVWIDHNKFSDAPETADYNAPHFYGRLFQQHDGLLDIVRGSDLVSVSNNIFMDHYKTMLWGHSDSRKTDEGSLRITFYNNHLKNISERAPRVRYGKVHVLNNFYEGEISENGDALVAGKKQYYIGYSVGNGIEAKVYSEGNVFEFNSPSIDPAKKLVKNFKGTMFFDEGSLLNGKPLDLAQNVVMGADMKPIEVSTNVKWTPKNEYKINTLNKENVKEYVLKNAGPGKIEIKNPTK